jgi:DNA-binding transcriptional MerR regulator
VADDPRYAIGDLADLGGVSRRTVRYYVQEGLLPEPYGVGRGNHYGPEHLDQLLQVKSLQEGGRTLDEIRRAINHKVRTREHEQPVPALERTVWRRITLVPGVELNVAGDVRLPGPGKLTELAAWCRVHFPANVRGEDDDG